MTKAERVHAAKLPGQRPGTVVDIDGTLWMLADTVQELCATGLRHGVLRQ